MEMFPAGVVIGLIGDSGARVSEFLRNAPAGVVRIDYDLDTRDALGKAEAEIEIEQQRRAGGRVVLASHDEELLRRTADEVWWIREGQVAQKGDPRDVLAAYRRDVLRRRPTKPSPLQPTARRGDGRAELLEILTLNAAGEPVGGWGSGDEALVRVRVRFHADVADPVVGVMIRTRIGMEVYGTNTELEGVKVGPCAAGETRVVDFRFSCNLCPQSYTLTAASHDPDGVWHDWLEDAVAFTVGDTRYTAGVANLRARVTCCRE